MSRGKSNWDGLSARAIKIVYKMLSGKPGENRWLGWCIWGDGGMGVLEWILKEQGEKVRTVFMWLRRGASGGLLWTRSWTFWLHTRKNFLTRWAIISLSITLLHEVVLMIFIDVILIMTIKNRVDQLVEWITSWTTGVRFPAGGRKKIFSLRHWCYWCVQTDSVAHPASCPIVTGGSFPSG
jgi:hypothetical protein